MEEPRWLSRTLIEALHADQVREHGGAIGMRDPGLLESALAQPQHVWTYKPDADLAMIVAEYGVGLAKNHAFMDGNKRIAFVATNVFLILNGFEIEAPETEVVDTILRVSDGRMNRPGFAAWIRTVMTPYQA